MSRLAAAAVLTLTFIAIACGSGRPALTFEPAELPAAVVGDPYVATITSGRNETPVGDIFVAGGELPSGLTLEFEAGGSSNTAQIVGTPGETGTFQFMVGAWCLGTNVSGQAGEHDYTLVVN